MLPRIVDLTYDLVRAFDRAATVEALNAHLLRTVAGAGIESTFAGVIPIPGTRPTEQAAHVLIDSTPRGWTEHYFRAGFLERDPTIRRVTSSTAPFLWSEIEPQYRADPAARRVMDEAGSFGLRAGFTVPLVTLDGRVAGFSFGAERLDLSPDLRGMLHLVAAYAFGRSLAINEGAARESVRLTPREREALQWAAAGKSEWEIGELMSISEHGAEKHLRSVHRKLGAGTRTQAVAEAIRRGLIA